MASVPDAFWVTVVPAAGTVPKLIGLVSVNVAVGNCDVFMIRPWNWPSRSPESLLTLVKSTVTVVFVTWVAVAVS